MSNAEEIRAAIRDMVRQEVRAYLDEIGQKSDDEAKLAKSAGVDALGYPTSETFV